MSEGVPPVRNSELRGGHSLRSRVSQQRQEKADIAHDDLPGVRVAVLVSDGFEQVEMATPRQALDEAGARTTLVSPKDGRVKGWKMTEWGDSFPVDQQLGGARPEAFDALLLAPAA